MLFKFDKIMKNCSCCYLIVYTGCKFARIIKLKMHDLSSYSYYKHEFLSIQY